MRNLALIFIPVLILSRVCEAQKMVYTNDFETGTQGTSAPGVVPSWSTNNPGPTDGQGIARAQSNIGWFLGQFGKETVSLNLTNIPAHDSITISFDFYAIGSWDGNDGSFGPDIWSFNVDGTDTLLYATFANWIDAPGQSYPDRYDPNTAINNPRQTGATKTNVLGINTSDAQGYGDAIYHLQYTVPDQGSSVTFHFVSDNTWSPGDHFSDDENWGIDNVEVSAVTPVPDVAPCPTTALTNNDFTNDLSGWQVELGGNPAAVLGTATWSSQYGGSAKIDISGSPGNVDLVQALKTGLCPGDTIKWKYTTTDASGSHGLGLSFQDASKNTLRGWGQTFWDAPGGNGTNDPVGTYEKSVVLDTCIPAGDSIHLSATVWPGTTEYFYHYIDICPGPGLPAPVITASSTSFCDGDSVTLNAADKVPGLSYLWSPGGQTTQSITVYTGGMYNVTAFCPGGCTAENSIVLTEYPKVIAALSPSKSIMLCSGNDTTLRVSPAGMAYQWWLDGNPLNGDTGSSLKVDRQGIYSVIVTNSNGCSDTASDTVMVDLPPPTRINSWTDTIGFELCPGADTVLRASSGRSYLWSNGDTTDTVTITNSGSFFVTVTDSSGCSATSLPVNVSYRNPAIYTLSASSDTALECLESGDTVIRYIILQNERNRDEQLHSVNTNRGSFPALPDTILPANGMDSIPVTLITNGGPIYTGSYSFVDSCGNVQGPIALKVSAARQMDTLHLVNLDPGTLRPGTDRTVAVVDTPFATTQALAQSGAIVFEIDHDPSTLEIDSLYSPCGIAEVQEDTMSGRVIVKLNSPCPGLTDDTLAYIRYHTVVGNTLTPLIRLTASLQDSCFEVAAADSTVLNLSPFGCEITTVVHVTPFASRIVSISPNPSSSEVAIQYEVVEPVPVQITLSDVLGRTVEKVTNTDVQRPGRYTASFDSSNIAAGLYLVTYSAGDARETRWLLIKH